VGLASSPAAGQGTWGGKFIVNNHFSIGIGLSFSLSLSLVLAVLDLQLFGFLLLWLRVIWNWNNMDQWLAGQCLDHEVRTESALAASRRDDKCGLSKTWGDLAGSLQVCSWRRAEDPGRLTYWLVGGGGHQTGFVALESPLWFKNRVTASTSTDPHPTSKIILCCSTHGRRSLISCMNTIEIGSSNCVCHHHWQLGDTTNDLPSAPKDFCGD
jgi:hypothetical protein